MGHGSANGRGGGWHQFERGSGVPDGAAEGTEVGPPLPRGVLGRGGGLVGGHQRGEQQQDAVLQLVREGARHRRGHTAPWGTRGAGLQGGGGMALTTATRDVNGVDVEKHTALRDASL